MASQELILCFSTAAEIAGHLPVKKKAAHINPEAPGAPEITKLERGGHFVQSDLISASIWSKVFSGGSKSHSLDITYVSEICKKCNERGPRGSPWAHIRSE